MKNDIIFQRYKVCSSKVIQYGQLIVGIVKGRKSIITNYLLPLVKLVSFKNVRPPIKYNY